MPAWYRRSHVPGWRGVAATGSRAGTMLDRFIAGMPAWDRRSHAQVWGGFAMTGAGEESSFADTGLGPARPLAPTIGIRRAGGGCSATGASVY